VQTAGAGAKFYVSVNAVGGACAIPKTRTAVNALIPFECRLAAGAFSDGLAGTHSHASFFIAGLAESGVAKRDVVGEARHGLHFATD
jgi:hypothetical protein